jgi:hypothetical protein
MPLVALPFMLLAAACGDSGTKDAGGGQTETDPPAVETAAVPTGTTAQAAEAGPPTRQEVRWVGGIETWWVRLAEAAETASGFAQAAAAGRDPKPATVRAAKRALDTVMECTRMYESMAGRPPSERLEDVGELVRDACESFEAGAEAGLAAIEDPMDAEAFEEWGRHWTAGQRLFEGLREPLAYYDPANRRELPVRKGASAVSRIEPTFSHLAYRLVPPRATWPPTRVRCWAERDWVALLREMSAVSPGRYPVDSLLGFTHIGDHRINLSPGVCEALVALRYEGARPTGDAQLAVALGVATLAHEMQHTAGVASEAAAECYGMQTIKRVARRLGAEPEYADALVQRYWQEIYPRNPPRYRSGECRDLGALDRSPRTSAWP